MGYQVVLKSSVERQTLIKRAIEASNHTREFYDFRSQRTELPFIRLPESALLYRMENFRTFIGQKDYIKRENKSADFFGTGQETESVQQLQHEILAKLARKGVSDSVVPIIDVLRTDKQREPLLISYKGVAINGNRRLAGMRELLDENQQLFKEFTHVDCLVLPQDATADEIVDIEAALQAKPETRLDYDWIGECQLIARLLKTHHDIDVVAQRLNRKPAEVRNSLNALTEADLYLRDWADAEGEYGRVVDSFQLFKDMPSSIEGKSPELAEASRAIAWSLFEKRSALQGRLYSFNSTFGAKAADVLSRVATSLNIPLVQAEKPVDDGNFSIEIEPEQTEISYRPIIQALRNPKTKEEVTETLIDVCKNIVEAAKEAKGGGAALKAITQINAKLKDVDIGSSDPTTHDAISKQLEEIFLKVSGIRKILQKLKGSGVD